MDIILTGLQVLIKEWNGVLGIFGVLLLGSAIAILWIRIIFGNGLSLGDFFALGIGGGWITLFPPILLTVLLRFVFGIQINLIALCIGILVISIFASYWIKRPQHTQAVDSNISSILALFTILILSILMRLAFISKLIMPPYFDSPMHYSIVKNLISDFENLTFPAFSTFVGGYYHLGFHVLVAALSLSLGMDVKEVILIFGQISLAIIPLPLFFIIRRETKLVVPALFATVLAGWGWPFPAHAINWGKYPALTSILAFEIVMCGIFLAVQATKQRRWFIVYLVCISILISTFVHTRSLILISFAILSGLLALVWFKSNLVARSISFFLLVATLSALMFVARTKPILSMAFDPYQTSGLWTTLLVASLFPFALRRFSRATFAAIIFLLLVFGSLFISVVQILPAYDAQTLLDRPYAEMVFFLPIAFLGGLGYAGMIETLHAIDFLKGARQKWLNGALVLLLFGAIGVNTSRYSFFPSDCCNFFNGDDAIALDWMDKNIPLNANILIASAQAVVFENTTSAQYAGSDSGIWITPLIHRSSTLLSYETDFNQQDTLDKLCKNGITHIYISEKGAHFNRAQLNSIPDRFENLLRLPGAQVYKLVDCP
jgi:hypothetical protein